MSGMRKRRHGRTTKAPPDERGGNRYVQPKATASHLDSTHKDHRPMCSEMTWWAMRGWLLPTYLSARHPDVAILQRRSTLLQASRTDCRSGAPKRVRFQ